MDYDRTAIPAAYDAGRGYSSSTRNDWLNIIRASAAGRPINDILDLGCGTGRYTSILADCFDGEVVAVDPSNDMLAIARAKAVPRASYLAGSAQKIPLANAAIDLIFMSMVFHHIDDRQAAVSESTRILRDGGLLCLRAMTADRIDQYPFVPYFPECRDFLEENLDTQAEVEHIFARGGFNLLEHHVIENHVAPDLRAFADKIADRPYSTLVRLTDEEFENGLDRLRKHAARTKASEPITEPIDYFVFESRLPRLLEV